MISVAALSFFSKPQWKSTSEAEHIILIIRRDHHYGICYTVIFPVLLVVTMSCFLVGMDPIGCSFPEWWANILSVVTSARGGGVS